jgi:hypothetical protein
VHDRFCFFERDRILCHVESVLIVYISCEQKKKGKFQHSSFLAGAATTAAGRLVAKDGILKAIWPYSGHYLPTEENFKEFISFLEENSVDLTNVKVNLPPELHLSS